MKKKNIKSLKLNKKLISNVLSDVHGGKQQAFSFFCTTVLVTRVCYTQVGQSCDFTGCFSQVIDDCMV